MIINELIDMSMDIQDSMTEAHSVSVRVFKNARDGIPSLNEIESLISLLSYGRHQSEEIILITDGRLDDASLMVKASASIVANHADSLIKRLEKLKCQMN